MYYQPVLMGDEITTLLYDIRGGLRECHLFEPIYTPYTTPSFWGNLYPAPVFYSPSFVFSLGTYDGVYNYYDYYNMCRTHISYWAPPVIRRPPATVWLVPRVNYAPDFTTVVTYSAGYNVIRLARKFRDGIIHLSNPDYGYDLTYRHRPSANGLRRLARDIRYIQAKQAQSYSRYLGPPRGAMVRIG